MKNKEKILFDSPEAATFRTDLSGWVSANGRYYGNDEHMARYAGCTHKKCGCGEIMEKGYAICGDCREKNRTENFLKMPEKEWDGKSPISHYDGDEYFHGWDEVEDFCYENDIDIKEIRLTHTEPNTPQQIDMDLWSDLMPEDRDYEDVFSKEVMDAINNLNKILENHKPLSHSPTKIRIKL